MTEIIRGNGTSSLKQFLREHPGWIVLDFTQLELWDQCNRKWSYRNINHLATQPSWAADYSSYVLHPAMSEFYLNQRVPSRQFFETLWEQFMERVQYAPQARSNDHLVYTLDNAAKHIQNYADRYNNDFVMYRTVNSEVIYWSTFPVLQGVVWVAKPDVLLAQIVDDAIVSVDFKHSKWDLNVELLDYDRQFMGQAFVTGAKYIMKAHFRTQVESARRALCHLERRFSSVESDQMNEWLAEIQQSCSFVLQAVKAGVFAKHAPKACNDFNSQCEFKGICDLGAAWREQIEQARYDTRPPLDYLGLD